MCAGVRVCVRICGFSAELERAEMQTGGGFVAKPAIKLIREELIKQLEARGGKTPFFVSLVDDYCMWESAERQLWKAIKKLPADEPEADKLMRTALNASNRKLQILKQLDIKTTNVAADDDDEM